jgi:hypothetical protein
MTVTAVNSAIEELWPHRVIECGDANRDLSFILSFSPSPTASQTGSVCDGATCWPSGITGCERCLEKFSLKVKIDCVNIL